MKIIRNEYFNMVRLIFGMSRRDKSEVYCRHRGDEISSCKKVMKKTYKALIIDVDE